MSVKYNVLLLILILAQAFVNSLRSQGINYGFNNGKYVEVSGRNVYYEEYGAGDTVLWLQELVQIE